MGVFDSMKNRIALNLKVTKMSFMTHPGSIVEYCQTFTPEERLLALKNIDAQFRWQPIAQMAQALYPALWGPHGGVSAEALDLVRGGQVDAGLKLMSIENQAPVAPNMGMLPMQQSALSFAWVVLKALEQREAATKSSYAASVSGSFARSQQASFCPSCGSQQQGNDRFCRNCGSSL
jgi:NADH pyrophosphatase NudC (nudix superfamily)